MPLHSHDRQRLVLLVEDDADIYELYSEVLASAGFAVVGADSGEDAVAYAAAHAPDIIVMDYDLRGMDGALATELLKRNPRTRHIPVMMLTGHVAMSKIERARKAGCDAFLSKPCSLDALLNEVRQLADSHAMSRPGTVLLVEDDETIRVSAAELLRDDGFTVLEATNGHDALTLLRTDDALPDVILLDLTMPVMDGFAFRSEQLADPRLSRIPVIIISATKDASSRQKLDVDEFVAKPFDGSKLLDAIGRQLSLPQH
jgi:CheY-like chemotaxis protein